MTRWPVLLLLAPLIVCLAVAAAQAQRLVSALSDTTVSIDSNFSGDTLTLFGNVEPEIGAQREVVDGPFNIIMVIRGPAIDRVARRKTRNFGIWINDEQLVFKSFPSYFWVLSSQQLESIAARETLAAEGLLPETRPQLSVVQGGGNPDVFGPELVRLMTEKGLFGVDERGVTFQSDTLYSARVSLPADVPNGNFLAQTFLFRNGVMVSQKSESFLVQKTGFERLVGTSAQEYPWAYGFACVFLAVGTGWLGGVIFRR